MMIKFAAAFSPIQAQKIIGAKQRKLALVRRRGRRDRHHFWPRIAKHGFV